MRKNRENCWDVLCGILIVLVVIGHSCKKRTLVHDIIFFFHMPLFFILSGLLLKREKLTERVYLRSALSP